MKELLHNAWGLELDQSIKVDRKKQEMSFISMKRRPIERDCQKPNWALNVNWCCGTMTCYRIIILCHRVGEWDIMCASILKQRMNVDSTLGAQASSAACMASSDSATNNHNNNDNVSARKRHTSQFAVYLSLNELRTCRDTSSRPVDTSIIPIILYVIMDLPWNCRRVCFENGENWECWARGSH